MDEEQALKILKSKGLPRFTQNSITDPESYYEELKQVRKNGYAVDDEEYILGVRAVASALKGLGQLKSAIWVVGFKASLDEKKMKPITKEIQNAAEAISRRIQDQLLSKQKAP
jgi:DNA-binding IclR family transcriptional regulator